MRYGDGGHSRARRDMTAVIAMAKIHPAANKLVTISDCVVF